MSFHPSVCLSPAHVHHCRVTGVSLLVYRPNGVRLTTHVAQRWYVRPMDDAGPEPMSRAFDTDDAAIDAVLDGSWDAIVSHADARPVRRR